MAAPPGDSHPAGLHPAVSSPSESVRRSQSGSGGNLDHLRSGRLHFVRIVSCVRNQGDGDFVRKDSRFRVGVGFSGADLRSAGRCTVLFQGQADRPCSVRADMLYPGVGFLRAVRYGRQAPVCPHRDCMGGAVAAADPAVYVSSPAKFSFPSRPWRNIRSPPRGRSISLPEAR